MLNQDLIARKFSDMIDVFRKGFENLSEEEKARDIIHHTLKFPCQFHVISSPDSLKHAIFKTHLVELEDKSTKLIQLKDSTLIEQLVRFSQDPIWSIPSRRPFENRVTFRDEIEEELLAFNQLTNSQMNSSMKPNIRSMMPCGDDRLVLWTAFGRLDKMDLNSKAKYFLQRCTRPTEGAIHVAQPTPDKEVTFGAHFYPPILVTDSSTIFANQLEERKPGFLQNKIIETKFAKHTLLVTKGGLICVGAEKELAEKILNIIMATALIHGVQCYTVRRNELAELTLDKTTRKIIQVGWRRSSLRTEMFNMPRATLDAPNLESDLLNKIDVEYMKLIIRKAEEIYDKEQHHFLTVLLGAATHLEMNEYYQSFIMSWVILENYLYELWTKKIKNAGVSHSIGRSLARWYVNQVLPILHLNKEISKNEYLQLNQLYQRRNNAIHSGCAITEEQAKKCYDLARKKIVATIPVLDKIHVSNRVPVYNDR